MPVAVGVDEVVRAVGDAAEVSFLVERVVVVCAVGVKLKITLVDVDDGGVLVAAEMAAGEYVGEAVVVDVAHGNLCAVATLEPVERKHLELAVAEILADIEILGVGVEVVAGENQVGGGRRH